MTPSPNMLVGFDSMQGPIKARIVRAVPADSDLVLVAEDNPGTAYPKGTEFISRASRVAPWRNFRVSGPYIRWTPVAWEI